MQFNTFMLTFNILHSKLKLFKYLGILGNVFIN